MTFSVKPLKMINVYHILIWCILIFTKAILDYSVFGNFLLITNLKVFCVFICIFYANYCLLLPFLLRQKPLTRVIVIIGIVLVYIGLFVTFIPKHPPFPPPPRNMPPINRPKPFENRINFHDIIFKIGPFSLLFSTLLFFVDKWLENQKMIKMLEYERQSRELKILREQINPHFFFNALNSIYSLAITQSKETPKVILILSDIMRYILSNNAGQKKNLSEEIINIKKYIEIQSIRFNKFNKINSTFYGDFSQHKIEPLLLLTFVENAFKYSDFTKGAIDITISQRDNFLDFDIKNFYNIKSNDKIDGNKMGIKNTKQKLDLLYPNKYKLEIKEENSIFEIKLNLKLD